MLIGVAARLQSGKDELAQYLVQNRGYTRRAFADTLKELAIDIGWNGEKDAVGRKLLQDLGVGARKRLGPDVWVNALEYTLRERGLDPETSKVVIPDCRFSNEARWIWNHGGIIIKIVRPSIDRSGPEHQHISETGVDTLNHDYLIINDGTLDEYHAKIDDLMDLIGPRRYSGG